MVHFLYQISTFSCVEGWGTCLAVQPASRMLLAGLWLLPDSGCGLLVLLAPCCFRIPAVGLAALGCPWLLLVASGSSCCFSLFSCMHSSAPVVEDGIDMGGGVLYWFALLDDVGRRIFVASGVGGFSQSPSADLMAGVPNQSCRESADIIISCTFFHETCFSDLARFL